MTSVVGRAKLPLALLMLGLTLSLSPVRAQSVSPEVVEGVGFQHKDWELACDNSGTCRAAGYSVVDSDRPISVLVTRAAGGRAPVKVELQLGHYDESPEFSKYSLYASGRFLGRISLISDDYTVTLTRAQSKAVLAAALRRKGRISLWRKGEQWVLSDQGARAALLKMDEVQGRLRTPSALVLKGVRDERLVPHPRLLPVVAPVLLLEPSKEEAALPAAQGIVLVEALRGTVQEDDCPSLWETGTLPEWRVLRAGSDKLVVSTVCWLGAYNVGMGVWVLNRASPFDPVLVTVSASSVDPTGIDSSQKGRGLGDCWSTESWVWDGANFVRTRAGTTGACRLIAPGGGWSLPTLVTTVQPRAPR